MTNNRMFSLPDIMNKAIESSWKRQELLSTNIANKDTPGYKRKDINFEKVLTAEFEKTGNMHEVNINKLYGEIMSPYSDFQQRLDGSNVDIDWEMAEVAKNKIKYDALVTQTSRQLQRIESVITNVR
ncbi:MAG TPA: flagellar basal body rod protein FlgB [Epulopiscium sp.]|nr:flagellar basal body rod protein FlgB [Candidatus Epulonipiscium sp.]